MEGARRTLPATGSWRSSIGRTRDLRHASRRSASGSPAWAWPRAGSPSAARPVDVKDLPAGVGRQEDDRLGAVRVDRPAAELALRFALTHP